MMGLAIYGGKKYVSSPNIYLLLCFGEIIEVGFEANCNNIS